MKRQENREKVIKIPAPFIAPGSTVKPTIKEINARKEKQHENNYHTGYDNLGNYMSSRADAVLNMQITLIPILAKSWKVSLEQLRNMIY